MGKYLDKTGLQYFYNKLKDKFADKSALNSLTGAMTWKGQLSALPTDLSTYSAGNVISVDNKEYVCTEVDGVKSWIELGDEGSYLLKTAAESTYLKKNAGEVKTANIADSNVTKAKLSTDVQTSLGKADSAVQLYSINPAKQHYPTVFLDDPYYGCLEVRNATDTDILNSEKPYVSIREKKVYIYGTDSDMNRSTELNSNGLEISGKDIGSHFIGLGENNKLKLGGTSSTAKEVLGGVATPTADTDAANKVYVDTKVGSKVDTTKLATSLQAITIYTDNTAEHKAANLANIKAYEDNLKALGMDVTVGYDMPIMSISDSSDCFGTVHYVPNVGYTGIVSAPLESFENTRIIRIVRNGNNDGYTTVSTYLLCRKDDTGYLIYGNGDIYEAINDIGQKLDNGLFSQIRISAGLPITISGVDNKRTIQFVSETSFENPSNKVTLTNIAEPTNSSDVTTKNYVDNEVKNKQDKTDDTLATTNKTIVGAINEVNTLAKSKVSTSVATTSANGLMSATDKKKLDGLSNTTVDTALNTTSTNPVQNKVIKAYIDGLVGDAITQLSEI